MAQPDVQTNNDDQAREAMYADFASMLMYPLEE